MSNDPRPLPDADLSPASLHIVHALVRFCWVLRRRKLVVLSALGISLLLGLLYFGTATRVYQSSAALLVLKTGVDVWSPTMTADRSMQDQMATYERLCTSAIVLEGALRRLQKLPPEVAQQPRDEWADGLRELLSASTVRRTSIIEINCDSREAAACAQVLNAVVASYLEFIDRNHKTVAAEIVTVLDKERVDLERRIAQTQQQLLQAKRQGGDLGIKDSSRYVHPLVERVVQLNQSLLQTQQRRVQLEASLAAIEHTVQAGGDLRRHLLTLEPLLGKELIVGALGLSGQESALFGNAERQLLEDQAGLSALQPHYGPRHPRVMELAEKIRNGQQYLASFHQRASRRLASDSNPDLGKTLLDMVQQDLAEARVSEEQLGREFRLAESAAIALNDRLANVAVIERDLELLRNLHAALAHRIENTDIQQNQADVRVSVINDPVDPTSPISPRAAHVLLVCLALGGGGGVLIVYVMDVLDDRFRSPEELQEQLGLPVLAMVRKHQPRAERGVRGLQLHAAPGAVESEAFRTLRTTLAFSQGTAGRLAVTSSEPGDGKTTVLANLGVACAQAGKRTLLIDGDLRRPGLTGLFEMRTEGGLSDILRSDENIGQMCLERIRPCGIPDLDILPCGPRPSDPAELLGRERFADLLGWAETLYPQILVDSPPILAAADVAIMGRRVDGVVVVVQPGKNHRRRVLRAVESLASMGITLAGIVVNAVADQSRSGYHGYGGDYGYGYGYGYGCQYESGEDATDGGDSSEHGSGMQFAARRDSSTDKTSPPEEADGPIPIGRAAA